MKIYLHIGTEKTGSSHLQSIAAINREKLTEAGIWFPEAGKRERQLLKGEISAGNAQDITDALNSDNYDTCSEIIAGHIGKAIELGCHSLLLSNELLVLALADENRLKRFIKLLQTRGCTETAYLLFIRDPVSHALSLYKHRAKSGTAPDIEQWPQEHYLYGTGLLSFLKNTEKEKLPLTCRKFSKKSGALEKILFHEWLGTEIELTPPPAVVNPSLSLSELLLIRKVREHRPKLANILYDRLLAVEKGYKAENTDIDRYHRDVLSGFLVQFEETWRICNVHLPDTEKITFPVNVDESSVTQKKTAAFSGRQLDEISAIIADSLTFRFKLRVLWLTWRGRLGKLKKWLLRKA